MDNARYFRWRLKSGNGEIVATSEGYTIKQAAINSAQALKDWSNTSRIVFV